MALELEEFGKFKRRIGREVNKDNPFDDTNAEDILLMDIWEDAVQEFLDLTNREDITDEAHYSIVRQIAIVYYGRYEEELYSNISSINQGNISISYNSNPLPDDLVDRIKAYRKSSMCKYSKYYKRRR